MKKLKFIVRESDGNPVNANGTSLMGEIVAKYSDLVKKFGQPDRGDGYKVDAKWALKFEDGTIATIYNWKDGKNYCGKEGLATSKITNWHVGGHNQKAFEYISNLIS